MLSQCGGNVETTIAALLDAADGGGGEASSTAQDEALARALFEEFEAELEAQMPEDIR